MLKKSEENEAEEVKKVVQTVAFFYAFGGVFLFLLTLVFASELLGVISPSHTDDGSFMGSLLSLLYSAGSFIGSLLGLLLLD